jgi:hypothetical protein
MVSGLNPGMSGLLNSAVEWSTLQSSIGIIFEPVSRKSLFFFLTTPTGAN